MKKDIAENVIDSIGKLPGSPAIYIMYGGRKNRSPAYVGSTKNLKNRMRAHFIRRQTSVVTRESAAGLNIDQVTEVRWYECPDFSDKELLEVAEFIAWGIFNPILRSSSSSKDISEKSEKDPKYKIKMNELFDEDNPTGIYIPPSMEYLLEKIKDLENRIRKIESKTGN